MDLRAGLARGMGGAGARLTAANAGERNAFMARQGQNANQISLDKSTQGSFTCAIIGDTDVITIGPSSYNHSIHGEIGIQVTGPFSFSEHSGNCSWAFENGCWVATLQRKLGAGWPRGTIVRHTPSGTSECIPFHGETKSAGCNLDLNAQGSFKITIPVNAVITIGPNTFQHSMFGNIPIIVTSPTTFTLVDGNASYIFQNNSWDCTLLKDIPGMAGAGYAYRFKPHVPGQGRRGCCSLQ